MLEALFNKYPKFIHIVFLILFILWALLPYAEVFNGEYWHLAYPYSQFDFWIFFLPTFASFLIFTFKQNMKHNKLWKTIITIIYGFVFFYFLGMISIPVQDFIPLYSPFIPLVLIPCLLINLYQPSIPLL